MVGLHAARLRRGAPRFQVGELDFPGSQHRMTDPLKNPQVGFAGAELMERYIGETARRRETHPVPQPVGEFPEGLCELIVERRAPVLVEGLLRHEQSEQFAFADLHGGKVFDRVGIAPRVDLGAVFDRQTVNGRPGTT